MTDMSGGGSPPPESGRSAWHYIGLLVIVAIIGALILAAL